MKKYITTLLIVIFAATVFAQEHPPMHSEGMPWGPGGNKNQLRERLEMIKMWKLVEMLELTPEQSTVFFPIYNAHEKTLEELRENQRNLLQELEIEVSAEDLDEKTVNGIIDSIVTLKTRQCESQLEFYDQVSQVLTTRQQAMLALFEKRFAEEVKKIIEAGKAHGFPGPR